MHLVREAYSLSNIIIAIPAPSAGIVFFVSTCMRSIVTLKGVKEPSP